VAQRFTLITVFVVLYRVRHQMVRFTLIRKPFLQGVNKRIV